MTLQPSTFALPHGHYAIRGRLTVWAHLAVNVLTLVWTIPAFILIPLFTFVGGLLVGMPIIGILFAMVFDSLLWLVKQAMLYSSLLWEKVPLARLALVIVGIPLAVLSYIIVSLTPGTNVDVKAHKALLGAMCDGWPLSRSIYEAQLGVARLLDRVDTGASTDDQA